MLRHRSPRPVFVLGYILWASGIAAAQTAGRLQELQQEMDRASQPPLSSAPQSTAQQGDSRCPFARPGSATPQSRYSTLSSCIVERVSTNRSGWHQCLDHIPPNATVYSIGIGNGDQVEYDKEMTRRGHRVFGFDPFATAMSVRAMFEALPPGVWSNFDFMPIGLGVKDGVAKFVNFVGAQGDSVGMRLGEMEAMATKNVSGLGFEASVVSLPTMMALHQHDHVDVLKIDVEGMEFGILVSKAFLSALRNVGQVIVRFHGDLIKNLGDRMALCKAKLLNQGFRPVFSTELDEQIFARITAAAKITGEINGSK